MKEIAFPQDSSKSQQGPSAQPQSTFLRSVPKRESFSKILPFIIVIVIVGLGIFSGLVLSSRNKAAGETPSIDEKALSQEQKESFSQTFRDEAEGVVERNDTLDKYAQGTHKLIRPGGENQTAYLTSSVLDLEQYVGKKVKVFGETFGSSQVGWLMDVGKVETID
ncbi:hypothetical protein HYW39_00575 [Candidatus Curtissbacteria bacterium]|nr:hypothetical protein [Candidatus Curtissbacteria bacterium]MBI2594171.1 hypothetical protein [Candidatus Curtissbacteria bacterium]